MFEIDYNPVYKRWTERMKDVPCDIKAKIDEPVGKENLKVLKRIRKFEVKDGDVFVCSMNGEVFYYGRVLEANIKFNKYMGFKNENCHLIFIFKNKTYNKDLEDFKPDYNSLLSGPSIVTSGYWRLGYFETIGNIPLTEEEKSLDYGFYDSKVIGEKGSFVKANGERIDHYPEYLSVYGVMVYAGIYMEIKTETLLDPSLL